MLQLFLFPKNEQTATKRSKIAVVVGSEGYSVRINASLICLHLLLIAILLRSIWVRIREGAAQLKRLHQIKSSRCVFFTRNKYRIKCTVHPHKALTEEAINFNDYEPTTHPKTVCSNIASNSCCRYSLASHSSLSIIARFDLARSARLLITILSNTSALADGRSWLVNGCGQK